MEKRVAHTRCWRSSNLRGIRRHFIMPRQRVTYANKACQLSGWKEANFIGTLAAAFAELGDFDAAVKYQKQAMAMGSDYPDKQLMNKALKLYQQRKPYRE